MSFKDGYKEKVNKVSKFVIPGILIVLGLIITALLLGGLGYLLWSVLCWSFELLWKPVLIIGGIVLVGFIIYAIIDAQ